MTRALVLGGGGTVGIAWETGLLYGLQDAGIDVSGADVIIGTSAGSVVGTQLALGLPLATLLAAQLAPLDAVQDEPAATDAPIQAMVSEKLTEPVEATPELLREIGALSLAASTITEEAYLQRFELLRAIPWPERRLLLTAVDVETGVFQLWDRESAVPLTHAIGSSCSVPGIFPPVTINGRRYMDGGMRSTTNADHAMDYDTVLIIAPITVQIGGMLLERSRLAREVAQLRASGCRVEIIIPDAETIAVFGPSLMDTTRRVDAARAGLRQAADAVAWVSGSWR